MQIFSNAGVSGSFPSTIGVPGTTSTAFQVFPALLGPGFQVAPTEAAVLTVPANGVYEGQPMTVHAAGNIHVHGTTPTINFALYSGNSLTPANEIVTTPISTLASAQSLTTGATYPWSYVATLQGDSGSGVVQVQTANFTCNGVSGSLTNTDLTGVSFIAGGAPALQLCFAMKFVVGDALNVANLMSFYGEK